MTSNLPGILLIEDNPGDARYIRELLREAREYSERTFDRSEFVQNRELLEGHDGDLTHESTLGDGIDAVTERSPDVVLLDLNLPDSKGLETLRTVLEHDEGVPVVVLTGLRDREVGIDALREGAEEYLVKDEINPDLLIRSIYHAIERKAHEREQKRYETLIEKSTDANAIVDPDGTIEYLTPSVEYALGYDPEELLGEDCFEFIHPEDRKPVRDEFTIMLEDPDYQASTEFRFRDAHGTWIVLHARGRNLMDEPAINGLVVYTRDITERKEYEQRLEHQREQLAALNQLNDVVNGITDAVIERSTREEIEAIACERLAASDSYAFAWVAEPDPSTESIDVRAAANADAFLESVVIASDGDGPEHAEPEDGDSATAEPDDGDSSKGEAIDGDSSRGDLNDWRLTQEALTTGDVQTTGTDGQQTALDGSAHDYRSAASIPITHEDTIYGALNVFTRRVGAFQDEERDVIGHLGEIIGHAIAAAERKQALMSESMVELEFRIADIYDTWDVDTTPDDEIVIEQAIPVTDDEFIVYGTAPADAVTTLQEMTTQIDHWEKVSIVSEGTDDARFELVVSRPPVLSAVASLGGSVEQLVIGSRDVRLTIHLPQEVDVRTVIETVTERYPSAEAIARRQITTGGGSVHTLERVWATELTDRQRTVLETAYFSGYFEWPRDTSGEAVAEALDISAATFSQHLRAAQNKIFDGLLDSDTEDGGR